MKVWKLVLCAISSAWGLALTGVFLYLWILSYDRNWLRMISFDTYGEAWPELVLFLTLAFVSGAATVTALRELRYGDLSRPMAAIHQRESTLTGAPPSHSARGNPASRGRA